MTNLFPAIREFIANQKDKAFIDKQYRQYFGKKLDWKNPKTYNEKLQVYKLLPGTEILWRYADKWEVRKIVKRKVGSQILNKVYGLWENASEIDFSKLPKQFVLKANHGSGWNIIVTDKRGIDEDGIRSKLNSWLKTNYYAWWGKERQYKLIKSKIICEKYLEDKKGELQDYKFFCFHGKMQFIQFTIDRFIDHRRNFYDRSWKRLPFRYGPYPTSPKKYPKPKNLPMMIKMAETLASDLKHARVDLYNVDDKIYFGEITLMPGGGTDIFYPAKYDRIYGKMLRL